MNQTKSPYSSLLRSRWISRTLLLSVTLAASCVSEENEQNQPVSDEQEILPLLAVGALAAVALWGAVTACNQNVSACCDRMTRLNVMMPSFKDQCAALAQTPSQPTPTDPADTKPSSDRDPTDDTTQPQQRAQVHGASASPPQPAAPSSQPPKEGTSEAEETGPFVLDNAFGTAALETIPSNHCFYSLHQPVQFSEASSNAWYVAYVFHAKKIALSSEDKGPSGYLQVYAAKHGAPCGTTENPKQLKAGDQCWERWFKHEVSATASAETRTSEADPLSAENNNQFGYLLGTSQKPAEQGDTSILSMGIQKDRIHVFVMSSNAPASSAAASTTTTAADNSEVTVSHVYPLAKRISDNRAPLLTRNNCSAQLGVASTTQGDSYYEKRFF